MDNMIHIGAKVDKETSNNVAGAIATVFDSARKNGISEQVQMSALEALRSAFDVSRVSLSDCSLDNSKTVRVEVPSDFSED